MKRSLGLSLVGVFVLVGACSEPGSEPTSGAKTFPLEISHEFGTTTIDDPPSRVVLLAEADLVVSLGVTPVAIPREIGGGTAPWIEGALEGERPRLLDVSKGPLLTKEISRLRPDLIVGVRSQPFYETLAQVAPTIPLPDASDYDWRRRLRLFGTLFERVEEADSVLRGVDADLAAVADRYPQLAGRSITLSENLAPGFVATLVAGPPIAAIEELGLELDPGVRQLKGSDDGSAGLRWQDISRLDADVILVAHSTAGSRRVFERSPPVVRLLRRTEGSYVATTREAVKALVEPGALSLSYFVQEVVPQIAEATNTSEG